MRRKGRETRIAALPRMYRERLTARGTAYAPHAMANAYGESHGNPEWFLSGRRYLVTNGCSFQSFTSAVGRSRPSEPSRQPAAQRPIPDIRTSMTAVRYAAGTQSNHGNAGSRPRADVCDSPRLQSFNCVVGQQLPLHSREQGTAAGALCRVCLRYATLWSPRLPIDPAPA